MSSLEGDLMNLLLACCVLVVGQDAPAQPPAGPSKVIEAFKAEAAQYVVRLQSRPKEELVLEKEPVLRWDNPARTGEDGALFVWTLDGRPEMIGTIFTYRLNDNIRRKHEYHSLATGPLAAEFRGQRVWTPRTAGVTFQPLTSAPRPAATARQRLSQMKTLAREFSVSMTDTDGQQFQLRLLPQPLLRYEPHDKHVVDGALFSFSLGTDPEAILLLEARAERDSVAWHYAFARFHYIGLKALHNSREVWRVDPLPDITNLDLGTSKYQESVYATYHVDKVVKE
jgi:hypothetical protein